MRKAQWIGLLVLMGGAVMGCERLEHAIGEDHGPAWEGHENDAPVEVEGAERWTGDLRAVPVEGESFAVVSRAGHLTQAPCAVCHDGSIQSVEEGRERRAHWQIEQPHGNAEQLSCSTCHTPEGPTLLQTIHGDPVEFDQVHQLCGSCHFEQLRDWKGGAHGKRVAAWAGDRVIETCTGCHDPHEPEFPVRLPTTFNPPPESTERNHR